ncbi:DNA polymerase III subunit epsilon [Desulfosarcina ovata subsp. sediminis]|uniref:DNA polymerase III subunit epsilon n=1 Tax=Desulfosarcina ovata subsp. sediminis TaxID=885957 RepID=A0A5K7ZYL6_9BACT|nr:3'-5' exonuclease [Desulfosarcina ovata]BBO85359.1 DNA polymerase III subunit epsilon [Desulfosarcina ovata subsp. sediminis]
MGTLFTARMMNRLLQLRLHKRCLPPLAAANLASLAHLDASRPAGKYAYTVVDLETTGLDFRKDRIVSIGAVKLIDERIHLGRMFNQLVNPGRHMPAQAITIHGIVPSMLASAPSGMDTLDGFLDFLGSDILVAHPAWFDVAFLNRLMQARYGFRLQNLTIDNRLLCERLLLTKMLPALPRKPGLLGNDAADPERHRKQPDLEKIAHQLGIRIYQRHSAVGDALATAMILQRCLAKLTQTGRGRLRDLIRSGTV